MKKLGLDNTHLLPGLARGEMTFLLMLKAAK